MFSFIDFKDKVSELALHAESKMIIFTSGLVIFYWMLMAPDLLAYLQVFSFFLKFYMKWAFFVFVFDKERLHNAVYL